MSALARQHEGAKTLQENAANAQYISLVAAAALALGGYFLAPTIATACGEAVTTRVVQLATGAVSLIPSCGVWKFWDKSTTAQKGE
jgi:FtsP/CotA-like multicopper oxidase with cupredoxin domain